MTKEEVLQKANDYCTEKTYTNETLTDEFKEKFAENFAKRYTEETGIEADGVEDMLKFSLDTVFSATSKWAKDKLAAYAEKEKELNRQIEELNQKLEKKPNVKKDVEIPKELQEKLEKLERYEDEQRKKDKHKAVLALAKKGVREDLHKSFENYASDFAVTLDETDEEQAKKLTSRFQEIFKDSIGDIKPLAPKQTQKQEQEILAAIPKVKVC